VIVPSTVADVYITGGAGQDTLSIDAAASAVTGTKQTITLAGREPVDYGDVERIDLNGDAADDVFSLMPSTTAEIHAHGGAGTDALTIVAPPHLATDTGTYVELCGHERIYYDGFESVTIQTPVASDVLNFVASGTTTITISDVPATLLTNRIVQTGFASVDLTAIDILNVTCDSGGNTTDLQTLDACAWLATITLTGLGGDDIFNVEPALGAEIYVEGGAGTDTLTVDALGQAAVDKGTHIEVAGYKNVYYSGMENVVLTNIALGTIVIEKVAVISPRGGFDFTDDIAAPNAFTLTGGGTKTFLSVTPGAYAVTEVDPGPSHVLTIIAADDGASAVPSTVDLGARTATIHVESGETVTVTFTNSLNAYGTGDVDGDGAITVLDVRQCLQIARGAIPSSPAAFAAADVNSDGVVDMTDVAILAEFVISVRLTLP